MKKIFLITIIFCFFLSHAFSMEQDPKRLLANLRDLRQKEKLLIKETATLSKEIEKGKESGGEIDMHLVSSLLRNKERRLPLSVEMRNIAYETAKAFVEKYLESPEEVLYSSSGEETFDQELYDLSRSLISIIQIMKAC